MLAKVNDFGILIRNHNTTTNSSKRRVYSMAGEWKFVEMEPCNLPEQVATGFGSIFSNMHGAKYVPVLYCGEQLVHGKNHMIICRQTLRTNPVKESLVKVVINQLEPMGNDWSVVGIEVIA